MRSLPIILLVVCNLFITIQAYAQEKLIFAIDVIRHGDSTPVAKLPKVPYDWKVGQLTATGIQQAYVLGTRLRKIYVDEYHLLPVHYNPETIYIRSSNQDRTLVSAQSFLMGLYPLGTGPMLPESNQPALPYAFQPIPIHTVEKNQDKLLKAWTRSPALKKYLVRYVYPSPEWKQKTEELKPKFTTWSNATGITITNIFQLKIIGDILLSARKHHAPLPAGLTPEDAQQIIDARHWVFLAAFKPSEVGKNTANILLQTMTDYLEKAARKKTPLKYVLFSAHDSTQLTVLSAMSAPSDELPSYASNLNFSLFERENQDYYVKISYNDKSVKIPSCGGDTCSLRQFKALVKTLPTIDAL